MTGISERPCLDHVGVIDLFENVNLARHAFDVGRVHDAVLFENFDGDLCVVRTRVSART